MLYEAFVTRISFPFKYLQTYMQGMAKLRPYNLILRPLDIFVISRVNRISKIHANALKKLGSIL